MKSFDSAEDREEAKQGAIIPTVTENIFGYDFTHPNFNQEILVSKEKDPMEINNIYEENLLIVQDLKKRLIWNLNDNNIVTKIS